MRRRLRLRVKRTALPRLRKANETGVYNRFLECVDTLTRPKRIYIEVPDRDCVTTTIEKNIIRFPGVGTPPLPLTWKLAIDSLRMFLEIPTSLRRLRPRSVDSQHLLGPGHRSANLSLMKISKASYVGRLRNKEETPSTDLLTMCAQLLQVE